MRVLQIIDTLAYGGAQKMLVTFASQARERGVDVTVVSLYDYRNSPLRLEMEACGARVMVLQSHHLLEMKSLGILLRLLRTEHFDIVQTHLAHSNISGALAARLAGVPMIATMHGLALDARHANALRDWLEGAIVRYLPRRVLAVAESLVAVYRPVLRREMDVIPNAVLPPAPLSEQERATLRAVLAGDPARPLCLAVGSISPKKGYADLLEAFDIVRSQRPDAMLVIVGNGGPRSEIEAKIAALKLGRHVNLLGARSDVPNLLSCADIYVNASHWEGLPTAHLEAMMAGLPVVATSVGETPRVVVEGAGLLVPPQKPAELARAILSLLDDPARAAAMGRTAREHAMRHYSAPVWFDKLMNLYKLAGAKI